MTWPERRDRPLLEIVRALPGAPPRPDGYTAELALRAEVHGLADVVFEAWQDEGVRLDDALARSARSRRVARELDHAAHVAMLRRIDAAFSASALRGVLLKGAIFAERYYARPASRGTTDIDLLVSEADLDAATRALIGVGYEASDDPSEARFRREHHHLHLRHAHALPLELHFHAYRGFGNVLRSDPLLARSVEAAPFAALRVLSSEDELVYLAVHAAAHRFGRLSWLYDMKLLVATMTDEQIARAAVRAREAGFARTVAFASRLLVRGCGVDPARMQPLAGLGPVRAAVAETLAPEPTRPLVRAATRFVYTLALCDSTPAAARYATSASLSRLRMQLGLER